MALCATRFYPCRFDSETLASHSSAKAATSRLLPIAIKDYTGNGIHVEPQSNGVRERHHPKSNSAQENAVVTL
jgi:hypothetical protein